MLIIHIVLEKSLWFPRGGVLFAGNPQEVTNMYKDVEMGHHTMMPMPCWANANKKSNLMDLLKIWLLA